MHDMTSFRQQEPADQVFYAVAAVAGLTAGIFLGLRLAGITHWSWWLVLLPLIISAGAFALFVALVLWWVGARRTCGGSAPGESEPSPEPRALDA